MRIDIFSDTVCPWCFIGKRRLERALAERPQPDLGVRWRAFQLNPDMPAEGMDRREYLERKFGGPEGARQVYDAVREAGAAEKIPFAFERIRRQPNSLASHRLIRFAGEHGDQDEVVERLFRAYFLDGEDIGEREVLLRLAGEAGLDPRAAAEYLDSDAELQAVEAEDLQARRAGIQGVPTFILNRRYALSGAQPPEVLFQLFDLAREEERHDAPAEG